MLATGPKAAHNIDTKTLSSHLWLVHEICRAQLKNKRSEKSKKVGREKQNYASPYHFLWPWVVETADLNK
jgi:hypothetical protein